MTMRRGQQFRKRPQPHKDVEFKRCNASLDGDVVVQSGNGVRILVQKGGGGATFFTSANISTSVVQAAGNGHAVVVPLHARDLNHRHGFLQG